MLGLGSFKRSQTIKTDTFHIDKYVDRWWKRHKLPEDPEEKEIRLEKERRQREEEEAQKGAHNAQALENAFEIDPSKVEKKWTVLEIDERVHQFIHELLMMGENDPAARNGVHLQEYMI